MLVTDGHLPYPFGYELTGYRVTDLAGTLTKAKTAAARALWGPSAAGGRTAAVVNFPGGYLAEVHTGV